MSALLLCSALLGLFPQAAAQCSTTENANCVNWVKNGFCNNAYTLAQKQAYCGISCGLCTSAGVAIVSGVCSGDANANCATWKANGFCNNAAYSTAQKQAYCCASCASATTTSTVVAGTDANANCAKWAADATNPFCVNSMTTTQKGNYCAKTCEFEIKPTADCAVYTVTGTTFARGTPVNRSADPAAPTFEPSGAVAGTTTLSRAFAASGCSVALYTDAAPADATTGLLETLGPGTTTANFFTVAAGADALSFTCTCT